MRIGIDYRLASRHLGGMAVYLKNLSDELKRCDKRNEYLLIDDNPKGVAGFKKNLWTIVWEHLWVQFCFPLISFKKGVNVIYSPNPPIPFFSLVPIVLTIPDVSFAHDMSMPWLTRIYLTVIYFISAHKAQKITTFSENSRRDISRLFKVDPTKITVTPLAASENLKTVRTRRRKNYVITVPGTFIARKNISDTILAFNNLPTSLRNKFQLLIVGNTQKRHEGNIIFTGRVDDEKLSRLYSESKLFICTSLYEGFGLPILEAMKSGVPVISYNNSSLPEVVGRSGILVNNVSELTESMKRVLNNHKLSVDLVRKGLVRARLFSWRATAKKFINTIRT